MDLFPGVAPALIVLLTASALRLRHGLNLSDEGYLVYGTQALMRGEVPIRDFRAYDPGRYYWCALFFWAFGPGFIAVRLAMIAASVGSVLLGFWIVERATGSVAVAAMTAVLSVIWMQPRHKQLEIFFSMVCCALVFSLLLGVSSPFLLGLAGGISAVFGLNILAYFVGTAVLASVLAALCGVADALTNGFLLLSGTAVCVGVWVAIAAAVPGFLPIYFEKKIVTLLKRGTTNLALPKPWIWRKTPPQFQHFGMKTQVALKALFTLIPVFCLLSLGVAFAEFEVLEFELTALILASGCAGLVYFHHVLSRADLGHLYQVIHPTFILLGVVLYATLGPVLAPVVMLGAVVASLMLLRTKPDSLWQALFVRAKHERFETDADTIFVPAGFCRRLENLGAFVETHSTEQDRILVAPSCAAYLALFGRKTAVYDTFPVYPATLDARLRMLEDLKQSTPAVAIVSKQKIDGRADLMFENNYPEVASYLRANYTPGFETASETAWKKKGDGQSADRCTGAADDATPPSAEPE